MVWPAIIGAAAALGGGAASGDSARKLAHEQMDMQREFAQMGIRWKVADAKAAGIHPLYALGSPGASAAPISVGDTSPFQGLAAAGQDIGRAMDATRTRQERSDAEATAFMLARERESDARALQAAQEGRALEAHRSQLANDEMQRQLMQSQISRLNQSRNPPFPGEATSSPVQDHRGRVDTGAIKLEPSKQPARNPYEPHREASSIPMWQRVETAPGVFRDFPSRELNMDSEIVHAILAGQAYVDKWISENFFGGAPKYTGSGSGRSPRRRFEPAPGSYQMDRGYQRYGVNRKGR